MQISFSENYKAILVQLWLSIVSRKTENLFRSRQTLAHTYVWAIRKPSKHASRNVCWFSLG